MLQTVKETVLEIKEIVFGQHEIDVESYSQELANRSVLSFDEIKDFFNNLSLLFIYEQNPEISYSRKKMWSKAEDAIINQYVELSSKEKVKTEKGNRKKTKGNCMEELNDVLIGRTVQSISYRYYEINREENKDIKKSPKSTNKTSMQKQTKMKLEDSNEKEESQDLLDVIVDIVENVDEVGIDVGNLFNSLLLMSKKAVKNNADTAKIEELEGKVAFLEGELDNEKFKNESLQLEVSNMITEFERLKSELEYFNGLNGKQKLQQLNSFNRNIKYMVDKFGGVISVSNAV